jgi:hypothetical protein
MLKVIKKFVDQFNSEVEFIITDHYKRDHIIVHNKNCQMERVYFIGCVGELEGFEKVIVTSKEQVIKAWTDNKVWF